MNKWKFTEYMEKAGYSQRSFAEELGMSKNTLNNKLNGRGVFNTAEVKYICEKLGITDCATKCEIFLT